MSFGSTAPFNITNGKQNSRHKIWLRTLQDRFVGFLQRITSQPQLQITSIRSSKISERAGADYQIATGGPLQIRFSYVYNMTNLYIFDITCYLAILRRQIPCTYLQNSISEIHSRLVSIICAYGQNGRPQYVGTIIFVM